MTQLNTPYPATAYLTGFLRKNGFDCHQRDPAMDLILELFSEKGLTRVKEILLTLPEKKRSKSVKHFLFFSDAYLSSVESAIRFLQGKDPSLALRINSRRYLPEGARFKALSEFAGSGNPNGDSADIEAEQLAWAFGTLGAQDQAKYLASLFLDDLSDVIREGVDSHFYFSKYGEKLSASQSSFQSLEEEIEKKELTLIDQMIIEITQKELNVLKPDLLGLTVPFPGNVYGAFRIAKAAKAWAQKEGRVLNILLGGGYVNTELRELKEPRVFKYIDAITLDDGEKPILKLIDYFKGNAKKEDCLRTYFLSDPDSRDEKGEKKVVFYSNINQHDIPQKDIGTPTYDGLRLDSYLSLLEFLNPMHRIWSDGRWNKLTLSHGCYWKKCSFCDVTLDYISRVDANPVDFIVDRMVALKEETGQSGFHFVDEAASPAILKKLAERLIERRLTFTWWGNIRFEKSFTPELCELLARSGCVAVSGGLEVASDRLLTLINKGVTVEQVARVTHAFTTSGVMVHAYLMYGFPSQTVQETIDSLERVRQLFQYGCIQSAFWHRFAVTAHSPIGKNPEKYGIDLLPMDPITFAKNDLPFRDRSGVNFDELGEGLRRALYNYMNGVGLDLDVREWFTHSVPKPKVAKDLILRAIERN